MHIIRSWPRPTESETMGWGPAAGPPGDPCLENHAFSHPARSSISAFGQTFSVTAERTPRAQPLTSHKTGELGAPPPPLLSSPAATRLPWKH